ncbi:MAG TPA: PEP-CTERM sorting domain-containing protein [Tepidisphaeraceae bacterium]
MSRKSASLIAVAALSALTGVAGAQVVIDGSVPMTALASGVSTEYGAALALQGTPTQFGNNVSELNGAYGNYTVGGSLNLGVTGNLEGNGNGFVIFLDSKSGGAVAQTAGGGFNRFGSIGGAKTDDWGTDTNGGADNTPNPGDGISPTPGGGSVVNGGFNPEKALVFNYYAPNNAYYLNVIDLTVPNSSQYLNRDIYVGTNTPGAGAATGYYVRDDGFTYGGSITHAFDNSNTAGVNGLGDATPGDAKTATTGFEMALDSDFLEHQAGKAIRVLPFITSGGGDYLSNQFLPGMHYPDANNAGGPGGFEGDPLVDFRTDAWRGDMFLTLFEPAFTAGGNNKWSTNTNWAGDFAPNGIEHDAAFKGAGGNVDVDLDVTVGTLKFNGSGSYNLASTSGTRTITMNAGSGAARIDGVTWDTQIHPKVVFATDTRITTGLATIALDSIQNNGKTVTVASTQGGTVTINAQNNAAGSIMAVDSGNVVMNSNPSANLKLYSSGNVSLRSGRVDLNELGVNPGGRVTVASRANSTGTGHMLRVKTLNIGNGGTLDLNDNNLIVENGNFANIIAKRWEGYRDAPDSTATGITSSAGQTITGAPILAVFDNSIAGFSEFPFTGGEAVPSTAVVGQFTYIGDADLNGQVTPDDYGAIDSNLGQHVGTAEETGGMNWFAGDWNFDGDITPDDYGAVDANLGNGQTQGPALAANGLAAVPEPASLGLIGVAATGLLARRRRAR